MKRIIIGAAIIAASTAASAQLTSDQVPHQRTIPISEELKRELAESRYRLGNFRVQPAFAIRDFGYDNNVYATSEDPVGDWRSTVAAGVRAVAPMGSKMFLRADVIPEYVFYRRLANRRAFGGTYDAALLGLFNRMSAEVGAGVVRGIAPVNSENERAVLGTLNDLHAGTEIFVLRRLSVFGETRDQRQRYAATADDLQRGLSLQSLERNENLARGGIRYRFASYLDISTAFERTRTDFVTAVGRDNNSTAVILGLRYDRARSFINLSVGTRKGEPRLATSTFVPYSMTTGSYYAAHELPSRISVDVYGNRGVSYSRSVENAYFAETRNGLGLIAPLGQRIALRAYGEAGTNAYPLPVKSIQRNDKVRNYGGGFAVRLYRNIAFTALASSNRVDSNVAGNNRTVFRITTALTFGGGLFR